MTYDESQTVLRKVQSTVNTQKGVDYLCEGRIKKSFVENSWAHQNFGQIVT
jgi:hypothetical protein